MYCVILLVFVTEIALTYFCLENIAVALRFRKKLHSRFTVINYKTL